MFKNAGSSGAGGAAKMHQGNDRGRLPPLETARELALDAVLFLAGDSLRLTKFLNTTGMAVGELRERAGEAETLAAVLEYLLADETLLLVFSANGGHHPADVAPALERLQRDGDM
jgi:hypothetical protein